MVQSGSEKDASNQAHGGRGSGVHRPRGGTQQQASSFSWRHDAVRTAPVAEVEVCAGGGAVQAMTASNVEFLAPGQEGGQSFISVQSV